MAAQLLQRLHVRALLGPPCQPAVAQGVEVDQVALGVNGRQPRRREVVPEPLWCLLRDAEQGGVPGFILDAWSSSAAARAALSGTQCSRTLAARPLR